MVLIVIDIDRYYLSKLSKAVRDQLVALASHCMDAIRSTHPIVRVLYDSTMTHSRLLTIREKADVISGKDDRGLGSLKHIESDWLFVKNKVSAAQPALLAALPAPSQTVLVIMGTNTGECIANSLKDFVLKGYRCVVVTDGLGDYHHIAPDPQWHEDTLRQTMHTWIPDLTAKIVYMTSKNFLQYDSDTLNGLFRGDKEKPALPFDNAGFKTLPSLKS